MSFGFLIEIVIKSSLLLLVGIGVRALIAKNKPQLRHAVLILSLVGALLLPVVVPIVRFQTTIPIPQQVADKVAPSPSFDVNPQLESSETIHPQPPVRAAVIPWLEIGFAIWSIGFGVVVLRYLMGLASLRRVKAVSSSVVYPPDMEVGPTWELRMSDESQLGSAMTWGYRRPVVLLPNVASQWTDERLKMILLHEFAHLRRKDFVSQMLAELSCAVYWFNPLAWHCARAIREEAELAADDAVIAAGIRPTDYATELLEIAANLSMRNSMLTRVGISHMTQSKIESRLKAILSSNARRPQKGSALLPILAGVALTGGAISGIASLKIQDPEQTPESLQKEALNRAKMLSVASLIYAADYDDRFSYGDSAKKIEEITMPYVKDKKVFKSPRQGAEFKFNLNVAGVYSVNIAAPQATPLWYEVTPKGINPVVSYCDGHAKVIPPEGMKTLKEALKKTFAGTSVRNGGGVGN